MNFLTTTPIHFSRRYFRQSLCVALLVIGSVSCKKDAAVEPDSGRVVFWSANKAVESVKVDCYVDGKKLGTLSKVTA
ncbi:hypothetical protein [Larkinella knui]|uniref:Uncharacterized protein n=1 Tax=Larkinella knui TaxID=2025310 RepID=A0A3P1CVS4_9BACT|nr:hypothetical protein [Larkinella knui]RRB17415.1 hypothetical protein EHT87_03785 [Larkinella knui]